jgi:hypothetical protein
VTAIPGSILVLVRDLLFSSRIGETAKRLGFPCRVARSLEDFRQALVDEPGLVMVDLTAQGLDLDAAFAALATAGRPTPVLGWTTHALWKTTKPFHDRCGRVVTREQLTQELPELLRGYLHAVPGTAEGRGEARGS